MLRLGIYVVDANRGQCCHQYLLEPETYDSKLCRRLCKAGIETSAHFVMARKLVMGLGQVGHLWFGFGFGKISPKNFSIFFHSDQKISSGWCQKVPRSTTGWPLIDCILGRVGSEPISNINVTTLV